MSASTKLSKGASLSVHSSLMTAVMVLAAGFGTRLRPLTDERPKALVPLGDRPVIAHQIERIREQLGNVTTFANAHHRAAEVVSYVANLDASVRVVEETEILGTAGGLRSALKEISEGPLLVVNVDVISTANYAELLALVGPADVVLRIVPRAIGQGPVGVDANGLVARLRHERFGREVSGGEYLGVAALGAEAARNLPERGCLVADFMLPRLRSGLPIRAQLGACNWIDLGSPDTYLRANENWLRQRALDYWVSEAAAVSDGVVLEKSIVGHSAQILGDGALRRVVAWPSAIVRAPLENAIVTSRGVVVHL